MKKEKEKDLKIAQTKIEDQEKEIAKLQYLLAHSSTQQQPQQQQSSIQVVSVPTIDEQGYLSYPAEPPPQYRQAIYQQQAQQQNIIPNQNQIPTISQVPIYKTYPSNTLLNSEAMNAKLNPFSGAQSDILSSCPIAHTAQIPSEEDTQVDGDTFTSISDNSSTILFDPVIKKGIVKFEFQSIYHLNEVGIADKTVKYERKDFPDERGQEKIVRYNTFGKIEHIGDFIDGNAKFWNNEDRVTFEMDMDSSPRTLTFFVNDEELPNYVTNIPAAVRVWAFMLFKNESFKVLKFEALSAPTAKHGAGSRA